MDHGLQYKTKYSEINVEKSKECTSIYKYTWEVSKYDYNSKQKIQKWTGRVS